jgi:hypothetical protein
MKGNNLIKCIFFSLILTGFISISGCNTNTVLTNPFTVYFYTLKDSLPPLYIVYNNKSYGLLPRLRNDPTTTDSLISVICTNSNTEILCADGSGHVVGTFDFTFNNDGTYKGGGGGYLLFDTYNPFLSTKYNVLIRIDNKL